MTRLTAALVIAVAGIGSGAAAQDRERVEIPLTDPSRPAALHIGLWAGVINIVATDAAAIVVEASQVRRPAAESGRRGARDATGLTRLSQLTGLAIEEANNVVSLRGPSGQRIDLNIQVPVRTNLKVTKSAPGPTNSPGTVTIRGVEGDLEVHTNAGAITLTDVSGSVIAHSTNGSVVATLRRATPDRPMAFTSYRGYVDVTLPRSVKANVILQAGRGEVFTDFDVQTQARTGGARQPDAGFRRDGTQPIRGVVNGGGPEIELRTHSANVYLRQGNEGERRR